MQFLRRDVFLGYVKVEIRTRSPRVWGWTIYRNGSDTLVAQDQGGFAHAEDAWREGQRMLQGLEGGAVELNRAA